MKKFAYLLFFVIITVVLSAGLTACNKNTITINYYDNDELLNSIEIEKGATIDTYTPPTRTGYLFEGWYSDKELKNKLPSKSEVGKNINLYAKYKIITYTITFVADQNHNILRNVEYNNALTDIPEVPAKEGYLGHWDTDDFSNITSDLTINAVYTPITFTVTFKAEGKSDIVRTIQYGQELTSIPAVPNKTGFIGEWNKNDFGNITSNITVSAIYTPITLTVTFKIDGEDDIVKTVLYGHDITDIPHIPQIEGKTSHWDIDNFYNITTNLTVNAIYEDITITITFLSQVNDQTYEEYRYVAYGQDFDIANRPQPYSFVGYIGVWEEAAYDNITENITVYATYEPVELSLTFKIQEEDDVIITMPYNTIPYNFIQEDENLDATLKNKLLEPIPPAELPNPEDEDRNVRYGNSSSDIYSQLKQNQTFEIIWDIFVTLSSDYGILKNEEYAIGERFSLFYGSYFIKPEFNTVDGYKFIGWYTEPDFTNEYAFDSSLYDDITLHAKWEQIYCEITFPEIDGITINSDYTQALPYGSDFSFSITTELNILEVRANQNILLKDEQNNYNIENIEDDISIAIKTSQINIYILTFYIQEGEDSELVFTRSINQNHNLLVVPAVPEKLSTIGYWHYNGEFFNFDTETINSDMSFTAHYTYIWYNLSYIMVNDIIQSTVEYQNESFEFYSPSADERPENMLFDGWYIDEELTQRATKQYVINKGAALTLYPKWIPQKSISHEIVGLWYGELVLLEFLSDGTAIISDENTSMICSYEIIGNIISIMDEQATFYGENITFRNITMQKSLPPTKCLVYMPQTGWYFIDNYTIPFDEQIFSYYWYTDIDYRNIVDITQPLNPDLFTDRKLVLYDNTSKLVIINYNAMQGYTENNISRQNIYLSDSIVLSETLVKANYTGYIFRGWAIEGTDELLTLASLFNYSQPELNVYAVYLDETHSNTSPIEGRYTAKHNNKIYIADFDYNDDELYHYYTFTVINTLSNTFTVSIPFIYFDNGNFVDEQDNLIIWDEQNGTINIVYQGIPLEMEKNSINVDEDITYKRIIEIDEETIFNLISFDNENCEIQINNVVYDIYQYNDLIYYFYYINELLLIECIDINTLENAASEIPVEYLGEYEGEIIIEDTYMYIHMTIETTSQCIIKPYEDKEDEPILIWESGFAQDLEGRYIIYNITEAQSVIFEIDEPNDKYYFYLDGLQIELFRLQG